jgi:hypothetical protein
MNVHIAPNIGAYTRYEINAKVLSPGRIGVIGAGPQAADAARGNPILF